MSKRAVVVFEEIGQQLVLASPDIACILSVTLSYACLQILGNNECFEPYTSNIYVRRVLSGEFTVVNQHLLSDLTSLGLWSADTKNELVAANGSVQVPCLRCCSLPIFSHPGQRL